MRAARGFTLIELLIVIVILGLLMGLVGGLAVERLEQMRARAELQDVERLARGLAFHAFAAGRSVHISGDGTEVRWRADAGNERSITLRYWSMIPAQQVLIDPHGVAVPGVIALSWGGSERRLQLNGWLEDGR